MRRKESVLRRNTRPAFTSVAVRRIHEAALECWPPDLDLEETLRRTASDVSGLYIGDYGPQYISRGIVRHSIYSNKLLIVDRFLYPLSVRDEYNPILNPDQRRAQTLKNVNFWFSLLPWIDAGLVEIIRTPADFDRRLNWESLKHHREKFEKSKELQDAAEATVKEMMGRHAESEAYRHFILSAPDADLVDKLSELSLADSEVTLEDLLAYVRSQRERVPDFLEPLSRDGGGGQLHTMTTGSSYDIAKLTAGLTGSYLVTDLHVKRRGIELDREKHIVRRTPLGLRSCPAGSKETEDEYESLMFGRWSVRDSGIPANCRRSGALPSRKEGMHYRRRGFPHPRAPNRAEEEGYPIGSGTRREATHRSDPDEPCRPNVRPLGRGMVAMGARGPGRRKPTHGYHG
jgi:hypothetical protein